METLNTAPCTHCGKSYLAKYLVDGICVKCRDAGATGTGVGKIILTTETAHNLPVLERIGIVTSETVFGVNVFKDAVIEIRGAVGGRSETMQEVLRDARDVCLQELRKEAVSLGADAVVGVSLNYQNIGSTGKMLMLIVAGTAVKLRQEASE